MFDFSISHSKDHQSGLQIASFTAPAIIFIMVKVVPIRTISERVSNNLLKIKRVHVKSARLSKPKKANDESWFVRYFKEFATNTALHGYNHIVREDSTKWER